MKKESEEKAVEPAAEDGKTKELSETDLNAVVGGGVGGSETEPGQRVVERKCPKCGWTVTGRIDGGIGQDYIYVFNCTNPDCGYFYTEPANTINPT